MRVIATDIANLTDARYFAAWGVEAMAYNIEPSMSNSLTSLQLKEIVDWVEGPEVIIKLEGLEVPENLIEVTTTTNIDGLIVGPFIETSGLPIFEKVFRICTLEDGLPDKDQLVLSFPFEIGKITAQQKEKIVTITNGREVFLDANFKAADLNQIKELGFVGIILKGGEEEKVGFKSYDDLDEILETIFD